MNIYRPVEAPRAKPIPWGEPHSGPIPESIWNDDEIRWGMEQALTRDSAAIHEITKALEDAALRPLPGALVTVRYPYCMPPVVYTPGCMSASDEQENQALKNFAHNAYVTLQAYFASGRWHHWFVAPYFNTYDDLQQQFQLGVFVSRHFMDEMVE